MPQDIRQARNFRQYIKDKGNKWRTIQKKMYETKMFLHNTGNNREQRY